ncbi:hypothetical protein [Ferrimonas pelagia]|uniref:DUF3137 domain-containing protein n=1 Tax=Ferrimonas pelagia TaxID=1177826 RepID=A0ABP9ELD8_9GAMM
MHHSDKFKQFISEIEYATEAAQDQQELIEVIHRIGDYDGVLRFEDRTIRWVVAALLGLYLPLISYGVLLGANTLWWCTFIGLGLTAASLSYLAHSRNAWISRLSDRIFYKDALLNDTLLPIAVDGQIKAHALAARFDEFKQRDQGQIAAWYKGRFDGEHCGFDYSLFQLRYLSAQKLDAASGEEDDTFAASECYRSGFILQFDQPNGRAISIHSRDEDHFGVVGYQTDDPLFNARYQIVADEDEDAKTLLCSKVIELFNDLYEQLENPHIELNTKGELCLSFDDNGLIPSQRRFGVDTPQAFAEEIASHLAMPKLTYSLDQLQALIELINERNRAPTNSEAAERPQDAAQCLKAMAGIQH